MEANVFIAQPNPIGCDEISLSKHYQLKVEETNDNIYTKHGELIERMIVEEMIANELTLMIILEDIVKEQQSK